MLSLDNLSTYGDPVPKVKNKKKGETVQYKDPGHSLQNKSETTNTAEERSIGLPELSCFMV